MRIERRGTMVVAVMTPMEAQGLGLIVAHTAPADVVRAAESAGERANFGAIMAASSGLYAGLRQMEQLG